MKRQHADKIKQELENDKTTTKKKTEHPVSGIKEKNTEKSKQRKEAWIELMEKWEEETWIELMERKINK